jgi:hypothetical protein
MVSPLSFLFFSLQSLLSKISYKTVYRKHCKEGGGNCHNPFLDYFPNFIFFFQKSKNIFGLKIKNSKNNNSETRMSKRQKMARNWLRRVKNSKIKIDNIVFTDEEPR